MKRVQAIIDRQPDRNKIAFFIAKSNNDNLVAYKWNGHGVEPFWISTENVPAERRDPLNLAEELLYGVDVRVSSSGEWLVNLRAEQVRGRSMNLTLDENDTPMLVGAINENNCIVDGAYVQMKKGLIPDVEYVRIYGKNIENGNVEVEMLKR